MEELSQAGTISELLEALRDTRYKKVLLRLDYGREITLFDYEMTLDLYYFSELWKQKDKILRGAELEMLTRTFGSQIDSVNPIQKLPVQLFQLSGRHFLKTPAVVGSCQNFLQLLLVRGRDHSPNFLIPQMIGHRNHHGTLAYIRG